MNYTDFTRNMPNMPKLGKFKGVITAAVIIIVILILVSTSYYTVDETQEAVVTTFGKVSGVTGAGIHFKIPFGIQNVRLVDSKVYQKIEIGYQSMPDGSVITIPSENKMITGDFNIVNVDFFVEYKISDPVEFLYASENPVEILKNITQSQIRSIISSYLVDDILTVGKSEIQAKIKDLIISELEDYSIGLILTDVKIQDAEPPTIEVTEAFKSVETAKQNKQTAINNARAYENANIPLAEAQKDQLIKNAEYLKQSRINDAVKQVAMFDAMYKQYENNPGITKQRIYFEYMEQILPEAKIYINTQSDKSDISMVLPLDEFISSAGSNTDSDTP